MGLTPETAATLAWMAAATVAWDDNVAAVQAAKAGLRAARAAWTAACETHTRVVAPLRRKAFAGPLTADELVSIDEATADEAAARLDVVVAAARLDEARARFKAGVDDAQIEEVLSQ